MAENVGRDDLDILKMIAATTSPELAGEAGRLIQAVLANMPALLAVLDLSGRVLWVSRTVPGISIDDVRGKPLYDFSDPALHDAMRAAIERVARTAQPDGYVGFGPGRRGPRSRYENVIAPIVIEDKVVALVQISRDVSEEWELYDALRDREQRLSMVLDAAGMGTWRFDARSKTVELDDRARTIYGVDVARLDSLRFTTTHIHPDDRAAADEAAYASILGRRPYSAENRIVRSDGQQRWVSITGSPVTDERGEVIALMGTVTDVTDRREHEARARQAQRLEAIGQLTAGVAHNFNNVLASIIPTLALVVQQVDGAHVSLVQGASQAASRAADLVRQLMMFSGRNHTSRKTTEHAPEIIERTLQLCRPTFDRGIELRVELAADLPAILVDAPQIEQALLNLLINARDAVLEGARAEPRVTVRVTSTATPRTILAVAVEDNGPGVPEAIRERVFDPFFTTKEIGRGTGLGLSTAYAIAREHGGTIRYEPAVGGGACFTLELPALADVVAPASEPGPVAPPVACRVLVVDDEPLVLRSIEAVLSSHGLEAMTAASATEALEGLARAPVDVVLLDLNMPGMPWRDAVKAIRATAPAARIVVFTGGVHEPDPSVDGWLAKPASLDAILTAITSALGTPLATSAR